VDEASLEGVLIHVATIHWKSDRWIAPQAAYLRKHLGDEYRVYAWLNDLPTDHTRSFHYACSEPIAPHAVKLNILADIILRSTSSADDIILFLDGDAFPIGDVRGLLREKLAAYKLLAVQRLENHGDMHPHPCFCATTVGFWRDIKGDWKEGYRWRKTTGGTVTDVGGNLLGLLKEKAIAWYPLLRTNAKNIHPLFFGVYGGLVYHHGAGFRTRECPWDHAQARATMPQPHRLLARVVPGYGRRVRRKIVDVAVVENDRMSEEVFEKIQRDPQFYKEFM
jgi:hypothetical protein